jgi:hypothetical protein
MKVLGVAPTGWTGCGARCANCWPQLRPGNRCRPSETSNGARRRGPLVRGVAPGGPAGARSGAAAAPDTRPRLSPVTAPAARPTRRWHRNAVNPRPAPPVDGDHGVNPPRSAPPTSLLRHGRGLSDQALPGRWAFLPSVTVPRRGTNGGHEDRSPAGPSAAPQHSEPPRARRLTLLCVDEPGV